MLYYDTNQHIKGQTMTEHLLNAQQFSHFLLQTCLNEGQIAIDATMGNGHDTLFLANLVGKTGCVHAFDIQNIAIERTNALLTEHNQLDQCVLHLKGHEHIDTILNESDVISGAIFNLGYLPNANKQIITKQETTLIAIDALLKRLRQYGRIVIVIYYGHPGGETEKNAILHYVNNLPQKDYTVLQYAFLNQKNSPPFVIAIEKRK